MDMLMKQEALLEVQEEKVRVLQPLSVYLPAGDKKVALLQEAGFSPKSLPLPMGAEAASQPTSGVQPLGRPGRVSPMGWLFLQPGEPQEAYGLSSLC